MARITAVSKVAPESRDAERLIDRIRNTYVPKAGLTARARTARLRSVLRIGANSSSGLE